MSTYDTPEPIAVRIEAAAGSVRLVATDRTDTVVSVRAHDESRPADVRAAEQTRVDYDDGKLTVSVRRGFALFRGGAVDIDIALPSRSTVKAAVASADVLAEGEYADCKITSASGDLEVGVVRGNLKAATASGSIAVRSVAGNVSVATASGNATIGDIDGDLTFKAASGDLGVGRLSGGRLRATSASGSVTVATALRGEISVSTASGEVGVGVVEGTAARLDLITGSGAVNNLLEPTDGPADGDDTLLIQVRTGSGDIDIHRAVATRV